MSFRDQYLSGVFGDNLDKDVLPNIKHCVMLRPPSISKAGKRRKSTPSSSENEMTGIPINPRKPESREPVRALGSDEEWFSLASEEEDSGSDRSNTSSVPSTSPTSSPSNKYERPDRKQHNVRQERKKLNTLNKPKLLAILNIAVQWCKEPITTGDLLNWVKQGYLPYIDALHA
uniref:Rrn7/TAF1B N-terminal cyclin domain-containing protein n=1 Tax=Ciona savignyi TaxID=51511 RepID=H2ZBC5_CIOSA